MMMVRFFMVDWLDGVEEVDGRGLDDGHWVRRTSCLVFESYCVAGNI
jgi:hypothetical protein